VQVLSAYDLHMLFLSVHPCPLLSFVTGPCQPCRPCAHNERVNQRHRSVMYSDSVRDAADEHGFLTDSDISKILTQHSARWDDYSEWLGDRNSQTPLMAESVLAFLGY